MKNGGNLFRFSNLLRFLGKLPILAKIRGQTFNGADNSIMKRKYKKSYKSMIKRLIITLFEYIMLNYNTIDIFGKYCGKWGNWALFWGKKRSKKGSKC